MFHQTNNLYFGRTTDGAVRILKLRSAPDQFPAVNTIFPAHEVILDVTIPDTHWASIVCSVSARGEAGYEDGNTFWEIALNNHKKLT